MCVCMCVYVNIQTHVSSVDIARINALATTICCSFFFKKNLMYNKKQHTMFLFFESNLFECSIIFLLAFQTLTFGHEKRYLLIAMYTDVAKFDLFANYMFSSIPLQQKIRNYYV